MAAIMTPKLYSTFCLMCFTVSSIGNMVGTKESAWINRDIASPPLIQVIRKVCSSLSYRKLFCQMCARFDQFCDIPPALSAKKRHKLNLIYMPHVEIICAENTIWQSGQHSSVVSNDVIMRLYSRKNRCIYHNYIVYTRQKLRFHYFKTRNTDSAGINQACFPCAQGEFQIYHVSDRSKQTSIMSFGCIHLGQVLHHQTVNAISTNGSYCECLYAPGDRKNVDKKQLKKDHPLCRYIYHCSISLGNCHPAIYKRQRRLQISTLDLFLIKRWKCKYRDYISSTLHQRDLVFASNDYIRVHLELFTDHRIDTLYKIDLPEKITSNHCVQKIIISMKSTFLGISTHSFKKERKNRENIFLGANHSSATNRRSSQIKNRSQIDQLNSLDQSKLTHHKSSDKNTRDKRNIDNPNDDAILVNIAILLPITQDRLFCKERVFAAIQIAMETVEKESLAPTARLQARFADSYCSISDAMNAAIEFYAKRTVTVFLGPVCDFAVAPIARQIRYWQLPMLTPGAMAADFGFRKTSMFPLLTRVGSNFNALLELLVTVFKHYKWYKMKVIYMPDGFENIMDKYCHIAADAIVMGNRMNRFNMTVDHKSFHEVGHILDELITEIGTSWAVDNEDVLVDHPNI